MLAGWILPFDSAAAPYYADYVASRRAVGRPVATANAMTAAIARTRGIKALVTRNTMDFAGCGVTLVDPWQNLPSDSNPA